MLIESFYITPAPEWRPRFYTTANSLKLDPEGVELVSRVQTLIALWHKCMNKECMNKDIADADMAMWQLHGKLAWLKRMIDDHGRLVLAQEDRQTLRVTLDEGEKFEVYAFIVNYAY